MIQNVATDIVKIYTVGPTEWQNTAKKNTDSSAMFGVPPSQVLSSLGRASSDNPVTNGIKEKCTKPLDIVYFSARKKQGPRCEKLLI